MCKSTKQVSGHGSTLKHFSDSTRTQGQSNLLKDNHRNIAIRDLEYYKYHVEQTQSTNLHGKT